MIEHTRNITELNGVGSGVGAKQISTAAASSKKKTLEKAASQGMFRQENPH
jgi:hypothetical protein